MRAAQAGTVATWHTTHAKAVALELLQQHAGGAFATASLEDDSVARMAYILQYTANRNGETLAVTAQRMLQPEGRPYGWATAAYLQSLALGRAGFGEFDGVLAREPTGLPSGQPFSWRASSASHPFGGWVPNHQNFPVWQAVASSTVAASGAPHRGGGHDARVDNSGPNGSGAALTGTQPPAERAPTAAELRAEPAAEVDVGDVGRTGEADLLDSRSSPPRRPCCSMM